PEDVEREFSACGFAIENYYADVAGTPFFAQSKEFAVIAKKL
ncbi:MAG: class I SAM-dependent methyltransferase, partial [Deltaproteobacteria bacterium]|nr:class I SAM-dependent methyltransferase [Deltaproteobacteria bacterium]